MQKFENMDVIAALEAIMHQNTAYYQSDFAFDIKMLREAARSDQPEDKLLLWLSRPSGTFCFRERDVLLKDTQAYNTWKFCGEQTHADPENEEKMEAAIAELVKGKTLVVIAHKLPAIMNADQICVIGHGKLVAAGKHQDLIRSCPEYQKLWKAAQDSAEWKVHTAKEGA